MRAISILVLVLVGFLPTWCNGAAAEELRVIDGDTFVMRGITYRLYGIDAPEAGQTCNAMDGGRWDCGNSATTALGNLLFASQVECIDRGEDVYGRMLAVCSADGQEVNRALVEEGLAWSFRRYTHDYDTLEDGARAARAGIWQAETEPPWLYREHRWQQASKTTPDGCPIKGNINRHGERIYHAPWSPWYSRTKVNAAAGERWFCNEGEALAAGWRPPVWGGSAQ